MKKKKRIKSERNRNESQFILIADIYKLARYMKYRINGLKTYEYIV